MASLGLLGAAVAGVVAFALPKSSESESPIADTNTETTVSTDLLGQTTPIKSEEAAAPTSQDSNETEQARTYGEIMTADTPEEWLQKNNSNWTRALNTGDIRYVLGMFAEGINLTKQENTIVSFKIEKDSYGPEYQAKRGEILSIDNSTGFDDPDAKIRTIEAVVKNNYQKYIGVESYVVTKGKYTLVKEVLETGDGTFDVWVISAADEETIDKST